MKDSLVWRGLKLTVAFWGIAVFLIRVDAGEDQTASDPKGVQYGSYEVVKVIQVRKEPPLISSLQATKRMVLRENSIDYYDANDRLFCRDELSNSGENALHIQGMREIFGARGGITKSPLIRARVSLKPLGEGLFLYVTHYDEKVCAPDLTSLYPGDLIRILRKNEQKSKDGPP
ncbi:MAG: hypothetical protein Aurels2KO_30610 [Aureliella sp.]